MPLGLGLALGLLRIVKASMFYFSRAYSDYYESSRQTYNTKIITSYFVRGGRSVNRILTTLIDVIKGLLFVGAVPELGNSSYFLGKTIYA